MTKKLACIFIAAITVLVVIIGAIYIIGAKDKNAITVTMDMNEDESAGKVALIDSSSSYEGTQIGIEGINAKIPFSTGLYSNSKDTLILTSLIQALDIGGFKEFYILTDLESDPEEKDFQTANECEKKYSNVYVEFIIPDSVTDSQISKFKGAMIDILDINSTTLKFTKGTEEEVIWDNYVVPEKEPLVMTVESGNISAEFAGLILLLLFVIVMGLILLFLANSRENENINVTVNTGTVAENTQIKMAATKPMILDASDSVKDVYNNFIGHIKSLGAVIDIFIFNNEIKKVTLPEAEKVTPNGGTCGWEALKTMFDNGYKEITVLSDMEFNDDEKISMGCHFDKIYFVLPKNGVNHEVLNKVKALTSSYEEIIL